MAMVSRLQEIKEKLHSFKEWFILTAGLLKFWITGTTPPDTYQAMIRLHCRTNGFATQALGKLFSWLNPVRSKNSYQGILGNFSDKDVANVINRIKENGYYIFDSKLSLEICKDIENMAQSMPANLEYKSTGTQNARVIYNPIAPLSKTYRMPEEEIIQIPVIQNLMADESIRAIAAHYINANPILCSVNTWWSPVLGGDPGSEAAQLFHFDMSRAKWLNFFIYLTDVDSESGPHCVVKKSHQFTNKRGHQLLKRGYVRISDNDIHWAYGEESVVEIAGKRGTIIAVDTKCFHKGKPPQKNHRLMFELVYASSLFGGEYSVFPKPSVMTGAFQQAWQESPSTYKRYVEY